MNFILDVIAVVAWGWNDHPQNRKVDRWITGLMTSTNLLFHTSSVVELGFVRVSMRRSRGQASINEAVGVLRRQRERFLNRLMLLPDDLTSCREFPDWCDHSKHTTDAHFLALALAEKHGLQLTTLDTGIPGAFVIPE